MVAHKWRPGSSKWSLGGFIEPAFTAAHHFEEEQDPDPHLSEKLDPDPHKSGKLDPDPH